ncbi:MAG: serine hydrolase domain-containing protein, partial [Ktedonobacteraceae bacterium]
MHTQLPDKNTQPFRPKRHRRRLMLIAIFIMMGLLPIVALLLATWGENMYHATHQAAAAPQDSATRGHAQPVHASALAQMATQLNGLLTTQVKNQQFSGSVLVAEHGQVILAQGYGLADAQNLTPNTAYTRFYLGSVTKEFTAMATLILQARGKLHIADPICTYIVHCPSPWQPVTIHELLTHTSGIPELDDSQLSGASPQAWIMSFNTAALQFAPGSQFDYCSTCYQILAYIVQQVSGVPYSQFIQQTILHPLKMSSSGFGSDAYYAQSDSAIGYETWQSNAPTITEQPEPQWSFLFGSGLLYSTVEDLYRWDQALYTNTLVPQKTLMQAFTPYVAAANLFPDSQYGYGWFLAKSPVPGHQLIWHYGLLDGFRNYIGRYVDD